MADNNSAKRIYEQNEVIIDEETCYTTDLNGNPVTGLVKYSSDGQHYCEISMIDGNEKGVTRFFDSDGRLLAEIEVFGGTLKAHHKYYDPETKVLTDDYMLDDDGEKHGHVYQCYKTGIAKTQYNHGKMHGPVKYYYPNGQLRHEVTYVNDVKDGLYRKYDESGNLIEEAQYVMGRKIGEEEE